MGKSDSQTRPAFGLIHNFADKLYWPIDTRALNYLNNFISC